jgi:hypothetical protein
MRRTVRAGDVIHMYKGKGATLRRQPYRLESDLLSGVDYVAVSPLGANTVISVLARDIIEFARA